MNHPTINISVFTENTVGMLNRITIIFTRRHINIDSITASETELPSVYRYTIVVRESTELVRKVVGQLEKQIDVLKAFYHLDSEVVYQELALIKASVTMESKAAFQVVLSRNSGRLLDLTNNYAVVEVTGCSQAIADFVHEIEPFGILEFARSGRVAVTKPMKTLAAYLSDLNQTNK